MKSKLVRAALSAAIVSSVMAAAGAANAAYITQFNKTTNDGVFSLTTEQSDFLGVTCANDCYIGYFRVRSGNGTTVNIGDTFDQASMFGSVQSGAGSILGFFNGLGTPAQISYSSAAPFAPLGTTTLNATSVYRGVAFVFDSAAGSIVFKGTSTFNAGQSLGADLNVPTGGVPEPATWAMMIIGFGAAGSVIRRRKAVVA